MNWSTDLADARTAPSGPRNGISEIVSAHEAALMPSTSGSLLESAESTKAITCVSHLKRFGKHGAARGDRSGGW